MGGRAEVKQKKKKKKNSKRRKLQPVFDLRDGAFSSSSSRYGVQPLGNMLLQSSTMVINSRDIGLGSLSLLSDELLLEIMASSSSSSSSLGASDLGRLACVSKAMYVFSNHDSLWKSLVLSELQGRFSFVGSWRSTYIAAKFPQHRRCLQSSLKVANFYSDYLFQSWLCSNLEMKQEWLDVDNIERRSTETLSLMEFIDCYEEPNKPVLITGAIADWPAIKRWDRDYLIRVAGDTDFAVGPVDMKLKQYFLYADAVKEERPLYLFDPKFGEKVPSLAADYNVPIYFQEDLFSLLNDERPDYRWLIVGPCRSGSSFHIDPNSTSAWNAVINGSKKWIMFPPDTVPPGVYPSPDGAEVASPVSIIEWFMNFYAETKHCKKRPVECICKSGEVVFVPNGWWHLVINLEDSIAITQNYVSRRNLLNVLDFLSKPNSEVLVSGTKDRTNLFEKFSKAYESKYPGSIEELRQKEEKKKSCKKVASFWKGVTDTELGEFRFGF